MANGILKKVLELQKRVATFSKDKTNPHFRYGYASAEGVNDAVKPILSELGIVAQLKVTPTSNLGNVIVAEASLILIDTEDGSALEFTSIGSGTDTGDKHAMKAATAATKYATMAAAFASTGDDPEADAKTDAPAASTQAGTAGKAQPKPSAPAAPAASEGEVMAVVVQQFEEPTRTGKQPFKINTDQGIFQSFDKKLVDKIKQGSIVIYKTTKWGNDIVEVKNADETEPVPATE